MKSGPFLRKDQAHHDIAFSCVSYLLTSLSLKTSVSTIEQRSLRILHGLHGLHRYAHEFWIEHILQYVKLRKISNLDLPFQLTQQLTGLEAFWKESSSTPSEKLNPSSPLLALVSERVSCLESFPALSKMVKSILIFRGLLAQETEEDKTSSGMLGSKRLCFFSTDYTVELLECWRDNDSTFFTEVFQNFQTTLEWLLTFSETVPSSIPEGLLDEFRGIYGATAFTCPYHHCPRAFNGFATLQERASHQASHVKQYNCADSACEFSSLGFATKSALRRHNEKYHTMLDDAQVEVTPRKWRTPSQTSAVWESPRKLEVGRRIRKSMPKSRDLQIQFQREALEASLTIRVAERRETLLKQSTYSEQHPDITVTEVVAKAMSLVPPVEPEYVAEQECVDEQEYADEEAWLQKLRDLVPLAEQDYASNETSCEISLDESEKDDDYTATFISLDDSEPWTDEFSFVSLHPYYTELLARGMNALNNRGHILWDRIESYQDVSPLEFVRDIVFGGNNARERYDFYPTWGFVRGIISGSSNSEEGFEFEPVLGLVQRTVSFAKRLRSAPRVKYEASRKLY